MRALFREIPHNPLLWLLIFVPTVFIAETQAPEAATLLFVLDVIMQETQKLSSAAVAFELARQALAKARRSSKAL